MRVVLAPNAFKGTFDAVAVARAWSEALAGRAETRSVPMSDGGDGFLSVVRHCRPRVLEAAARVRGPDGRAVTARWGWNPEEESAVLESAEAIGLRLLERRDPLSASSAGLGRLIHTAAGLGATEIVVGLGGSATVDGGLGMARELGFRFEDGGGNAIERPADLPRLARIGVPRRPPFPRETRLLALADVSATLHGPDGAARAFAPQKGADPRAVERLAEGLARMEAAWRSDLGAPADLAERPGAGAAGGLGAGLAAFLDAELVPGSSWCADLAGLDANLSSADGVVTGEGRFDRHSLRGKATGHVLARARAAGVRAAVVCAAADPHVARGGPLVVDAASIGRGLEARLDRDDLIRLVRTVVDRWEAEARQR